MTKRGRKPNSDNGEILSCQISLKVTEDLFAKVQALAYIKNGGNVNQLLTAMLEDEIAAVANNQEFKTAVSFVKSVRTQEQKYKQKAEQETSGSVPANLSTSAAKTKPPKKKKTADDSVQPATEEENAVIDD